MRIAIIALLGLSVAAGPLTAQQHQRGAPADSTAAQGPCMHRGAEGGRSMQMGMMSQMQRGGRMMDGGMMMDMPGRVMHQSMRLAPARILEQREQLGLTPDQVVQLERLGGVAALHLDRGAAMQQAHAELERLLDTESPDTAAVRAAAAEVFAGYADMHVSHVAVAAAVRGVLTAAQLEELTTLAPCPMEHKPSERPGS